MASTSPSPYRFVVIDENADGRFLISKTLLRAFPHAAVIECESADTAFCVLRSELLTAIIAHRTIEYDGAGLVRELRKMNATVPIIMTSGIDRETIALQAGATRFLNYDRWLTIGTCVAEILGVRLPAAPALLGRQTRAA